jgi:hypothetical protein
MQIPAFKLERYFAKYEFNVGYVEIAQKSENPVFSGNKEKI